MKKNIESFLEILDVGENIHRFQKEYLVEPFDVPKKLVINVNRQKTSPELENLFKSFVAKLEKPKEKFVFVFR